MISELDLKAADLLERTADAFESGELQWCRRALLTLDGKVCAVGALRRMATGTVFSLELPQYVDRAHAATQWHINGRPLSSWNDSQASSVTDVIDLFKQTAKGLRNGE